ncbi:hypothetical protein [Kitasatospora herbaricolor]|uniref:hypothetical protein n=1 Tax=Kitasatospora herbaricolor TaxID=68217 RepID=UPI0036DCE07F
MASAIAAPEPEVNLDVFVGVVIVRDIVSVAVRLEAEWRIVAGYAANVYAAHLVSNRRRGGRGGHGTSRKKGEGSDCDTYGVLEGRHGSS